MAESTTGVGGSPLGSLELADPHRRRADARMVARAIREGWAAPILIDQNHTSLLMRDVEIARSSAMIGHDGGPPDYRAVAALAGVTMAALAHNRAIAELSDKSDRLDAGEATENVTHRASTIVIEDTSMLKDNASTLKDRYDAPQLPEASPCGKS